MKRTKVRNKTREYRTQKSNRKRKNLGNEGSITKYPRKNSF